MSRILNSFSSTVAISFPSTRLLRNIATITTTNNARGMARSREGIDCTINKRSFYLFSQKTLKTHKKSLVTEMHVQDS